MGCKVKESLVSYLDGELDPAEASAVRVHIESCGECRDYARLLMLSYTALEAIEEVEAPAGFAARVKARVHRRFARVVYGLGTVVAAAAAVLIVFSITARTRDSISFTPTEMAVLTEMTAGQTDATSTYLDDVADEVDMFHQFGILTDFDVLADLDSPVGVDDFATVGSI